MVLDPHWGFGWDCVVYDEGRRPLLTVQVKNWAREGKAAAQDYYARFGPGVRRSSMLLVTRDQSFWWRADANPGAPPEREQPTAEFLARYLAKVTFLDELVLSTALGFWLADLVSGVVDTKGTVLHELDARDFLGGSVVRKS